MPATVAKIALTNPVFSKDTTLVIPAMNNSIPYRNGDMASMIWFISFLIWLLKSVTTLPADSSAFL